MIDYEPIVCNDKVGREGLMIAMKKGTFISAEKISESEERNIMSAKVVYPQCSMRFIIAHAPQESDDQKIKDKFYESLMIEIERAKASDDNLIVMGDMNARIEKVTSDSDAKINQIKDLSANGKHLKELIDKYELDVLNFHQNAVGKWTRIQKKKAETKKSIIDYILVEDNLKHRIDNVIIDEDKLYTPWRTTYRNKQRQITFSDHTAMISTVNIERGSIPTELPEPPPKGWKMTDEGLAKYKDLTTPKDAIHLQNNGDATTMYTSWITQMETIVNKCFSKRKTFKNKAPRVHKGAAFIRKTLSDFSSRGKIQREMIRDYMQRLVEKEVQKIDMSRVKVLKETIDMLTNDEKFSPNGFWKLKKKINKKGSSPKLNAILKDGVEITDKERIKEEIRKEFEYRLRNRQPANGWEEFVQTGNDLVQALMEKIGDNGPAFTLEELLIVIKELKKGKTPGYDGLNAELLIEAGEGLLESLLQIFNAIRISKVIPKQWNC